jgi:hypothetical protein
MLTWSRKHSKTMGTRTVDILVEIVRFEQVERPDPTRAVRFLSSERRVNKQDFVTISGNNRQSV